jgi:DNA-binding IclR family transcriptional regulator
MPKSETIRSLERGLQVFKVLQTVQTATLMQVYQRTGISKPSLLRILATLAHEGMVHRRIDGRYHVSSKPTRATRNDDPFAYVAEVATP